jgi:hypothetical protein
MISIPSFNFIPMIIFGNSALALRVSDKQFEGLCGSACLLFNNCHLSNSIQTYSPSQAHIRPAVKSREN